MQPRRRWILTSLAILVVVVLSATVVAATWQPEPGGTGGVLSGPVVVTPDQASVRYRIRAGENIVDIMRRFGVPPHAVLDAAREHYDLARIRSGRELVVGYQRGLPHATSLVYSIDEDSQLLVRWADEGGWSAQLDRIQYDERVVTRRFSIQSSLWTAAIDAGLRPNDIVRLAEIFQWDIDFNTELRAGDAFTLVADGLFLDGELRKLGAIHAVSLGTSDGSLVAIRHAGKDGGEAYYDPEGKARRKPFLRSPLAFSRVSSGFNARGRLHPVTGRKRPHYGTDFAAATGTPIRAVGDGVVGLAGNSGGYGKLVRIRHATGHESGYAHMSAISVRKGQRVKQGQTIGKVGSTGLSTGPHCHYELKLNGRYIDPMKAKLPVSVPLPSSERAAFAVERDRWLPVLEQASQGPE